MAIVINRAVIKGYLRVMIIREGKSRIRNQTGFGREVAGKLQIRYQE